MSNFNKKKWCPKRIKLNPFSLSRQIKLIIIGQSFKFDAFPPFKLFHMKIYIYTSICKFGLSVCF